MQLDRKWAYLLRFGIAAVPLDRRSDSPSGTAVLTHTVAMFS